MNYRTFGCTTILLALVLSAGCASNPATASPPAPFPGARLPAWQPRTPGGAPGMLAVLETAMALQGAPYRLGGTSPQAGFDCSGFVRYVFGQYALSVPRTAAEQFRAAQPVDRKHVSAGDLVFFSTIGPGVTHVGIVVDPAQQTFVHAPGTGSTVRVERFDTPYWQSRLVGVRRLAIDPQPTS